MTRNILLVLLLLPGVPLMAHDAGFPGPTLKKVFPEASGFTARTKALTADQYKKAAQQSASKIEKTDSPFTFYVALGKGGASVLGTVLMLDAEGPKGGMDLAVGVDRDGKIHRVLVTENADDPKLNTVSFLDQIRGKTAQSPLKVGQDITYAGDARSAQALLNAVRRGLLLLDSAEGK